MIDLNAPDFTFYVVENSSNKPNILSFSYDGGSSSLRIIDSKRKRRGGRLKANGAIWTPLEINDLMSKSFSIIAPFSGLASISAGPGMTGEFGGYSQNLALPIDYYPGSIYFSPDFPEFLLPKELNSYSSPQVPKNAITWGVVRQEPGSVSGPPFKGTQELVPRKREYIAVFGDDTKEYVIEDVSTQIYRYGKLLQFITIKGQMFDSLIQYNIWSKSNYEVELLTQWFMDYMKDYRGMFKEAGVNNTFMWSRARDDTIVQMKNGYHVRSVLYYFRTEELSIDSVGPINRINLNVSIDSLLPKEREGDYLNYNESIQRILDKWVRPLYLEE